MLCYLIPKRLSSTASARPSASIRSGPGFAAAPRMGVFAPLRLFGTALALGILLPSAGSARIEFQDVTEASGLAYFTAYGEVFMDELIPDISCPEEAISFERNLGNGAAVGDYDNDGDLDVYFTGNIGSENRLYRNNLINQGGTPSKTFSDVTRESFGLEEGELHDLGLSRVAYLVDLNDDGLRDLLVVNDDDVNIGPEDALYGPSRIFRNNGDSTFSDVTDGSGFRPHGYVHAGASIADQDGDGKLDIYVTVWNGTGIAPDGGSVFPGQNQFYRNLGNFKFQDLSAEVGLQGVSKSSFSSILHDLDDDGDVDLYVAVDGEEELVYVNEEGSYTDEVDKTGIEHAAADMGIAAADFDNDDDLDLYVTNITFIDSTWDSFSNALWQSFVSFESGGPLAGRLVFQDLAALESVFDTYWGWGTEWVDADNDGDLDIFAVTGFDEQTAECLEAPELAYIYQTPSVMFENDDGEFVRDNTTLGSFPYDSRSLIAFDYDRDGDEDLLITNVNQPALLLENTSTGSNRYLHVLLEPDRCAVGATARASFGGDMFRRRDLILGDSYLSGTPTELHFGLDGEDSVESLEVEWPDGSTTVLSDIAANQTLEISCLPEPGPSALALSSLATLALLRRAAASRGRRG